MTTDPDDRERLLRLEQKVDLIFRHLGIDPGDPIGQDARLPPAFYEELARGKMLNAIKIYRDMTRCGLAEAKRAVESIARQGRP